jgi:hypothetical protein
VAQMDVERPRRASPARGVALIATAVIIGLFVLRNGYEVSRPSDDDPPAQAPEQEPGAGGGPATGGGSTTTTSPPAARPPGEVTVIVANTTDIAGAAGTLSDALAAESYVLAEPTDADPPLEASQVLYTPGFEREAAAVAAAVGISPDAVAPAPDPPPVQETGNAQVLVMLGSDLATAG